MGKELAIKTDNLTKYYSTNTGQICAIQDINLQINNKQLVVIMGPSGSGKSTLLKILGGIIAPTSGSISYRDETFTGKVPKELLKKLGYVFQNHNLLPWRTVGKNLELPLEVLNLEDKKWHDRIDYLLEMVGLIDYKESYPNELSGGMKQRIGVIRALVHDPDIILMDQPFGALDAITRQLLNYEFLSLWKKTQKTIVLITNNIEEALLLSSKIYLLTTSPGKIIHTINFDVPLSERNRGLIKQKKFNDMRIKLRELIKEELQIKAS